MTQTNKEILTMANAAVARGDNEAFLAACIEDVTWNFVGDTVLKGKQAVRDYMSETYKAPPEFDVSHLIGDGDFVTAAGKITLNENGTYVTYDYCDVWRFSNGKMAELTAFVIKAG